MFKEEEIFNEAMSLIKANRLFFVHDVISLLPCSKTKFYEFFPVGGPKREIIDRAIEKNKVATKIDIRRSLHAMSNNPMAQIALYKLIGTEEERSALASRGTKPNFDMAQPTVTAVQHSTKTIEIKAYADKITATLKSVNRYSVIMDPEIFALASAMALLDTANEIISGLASPFIEEVTTQGCKTVEHPAYALQQKAIDGVAKHSKLLGLDYSSAPDTAEDSPLAALTRELIEVNKKNIKKISPE